MPLYPLSDDSPRLLFARRKELQSMKSVLPLAAVHKNEFRDKLAREDDPVLDGLFLVFIGEEAYRSPFG